MSPVVRTAPARAKSRTGWPGVRLVIMLRLLLSSRFRTSGSVGEAWRLAEVRIVRQLVEHEVGHVGARDLEPQTLLGGWETVPVLPRAPAVGEGRRTDYRPI